MTKSIGYLVTLDGVDGVGKTTTSQLLADKLGAVYFKSPSQPFAGTRHIVDTNIEPLTRYFFFRAATQHDSKQLESLLAENKTVVCDRYIYSTYAYHKAMDERIESIFETTGLVAPNLSVLLTAPANIRRSRLRSRKAADQSYDRLLENDAAYQDRVQDVFQALGMYEVDTHKNSMDEVVEIISSRMNLQRNEPCFPNQLQKNKL